MEEIIHAQNIKVKVWVICGQKNILRQKPHEQIFRVDPGAKIQKRKKIFFSGHACFEQRKQYLGGLVIFLASSVCEGVWKFAKPPKFGFSFSKQARAEIFQMQLDHHRAGCAS